MHDADTSEVVVLTREAVVGVRAPAPLKRVRGVDLGADVGSQLRVVLAS